MFIIKPIRPTIKTFRGSFIISGSNNRVRLSIKIVKQSANKNTPFIKAPKTSARTHPNVFFFVLRSAIYKFILYVKKII